MCTSCRRWIKSNYRRMDGCLPVKNTTWMRRCGCGSWRLQIHRTVLCRSLRTGFGKNEVRYRRFHLAYYKDESGKVVDIASSNEFCCAERNLLYRNKRLPVGTLTVVQIRFRRGAYSFGESLPCSRCQAAIVERCTDIFEVVWSKRGSCEFASAHPLCLPAPQM